VLLFTVAKAILPRRLDGVGVKMFMTDAATAELRFL